MKKNILSLFCLLFFISCTDKKYTYIDVIEKKSMFGEIEIIESEPETIYSKNDSLAFFEAYEKFCITIKVSEKMNNLKGYNSKPLKFKLLNSDGFDIANSLHFEKMDSLKLVIYNSIMNLNSNSSNAEISENKYSDKKIDSAKIAELKPFFNLITDEFDSSKKVFYRPKSAPEFINTNAFYCYFQSIDGVPSNLRLKFQYYADEWLFIYKIQFLIDGNSYDFVPYKMKTDSGDGGKIWEWFDESIDVTNKDLINALSNSKSAKMKLIGNNYYDIKNITSNQILNIKRTLDLYTAMGGTY
jgi:hypothetical protein